MQSALLESLESPFIYEHFLRPVTCRQVNSPGTGSSQNCCTGGGSGEQVLGGGAAVRVEAITPSPPHHSRYLPLCFLLCRWLASTHKIAGKSHWLHQLCISCVPTMLWSKVITATTALPLPRLPPLPRLCGMGRVQGERYPHTLFGQCQLTHSWYSNPSNSVPGRADEDVTDADRPHGKTDIIFSVQNKPWAIWPEWVLHSKSASEGVPEATRGCIWILITFYETKLQFWFPTKKNSIYGIYMNGMCACMHAHSWKFYTYFLVNAFLLYIPIFSL